MKRRASGRQSQSRRWNRRVLMQLVAANVRALGFLLASTAACAVESAGTAEFDLDSGLGGLAVTDLQIHEPSDAHRYGLRLLRFTADYRVLSQRMTELGMRPKDHRNEFDYAIDELSGLAAAAYVENLEQRSPPRLQNGWGLFRLLPPYSQTWIACYPKGDSFGFRVAHVATGNRSGRSVSFASYNAAGMDGDDAGCRSSNGSYRMIMRELLSRGAFTVLPYPYAAQEFDRLVSPTLQVDGLSFHGIFFVDGGYFFRFDLGQHAYRELTAEHRLRLQAEEDREAVSHAPEWWLPAEQAQQLPWQEGCRVVGQHPIITRAVWFRGKVYWYTTGAAHVGEDC